MDTAQSRNCLGRRYCRLEPVSEMCHTAAQSDPDHFVLQDHGSYNAPFGSHIGFKGFGTFFHHFCSVLVSQNLLSSNYQLKSFQTFHTLCPSTILTTSEKKVLRYVFNGRHIDSYFRLKVIFKLVTGHLYVALALETYQVRHLNNLCCILLWLLNKISSYSYVRSHVMWRPYWICVACHKITFANYVSATILRRKYYKLPQCTSIRRLTFHVLRCLSKVASFGSHIGLKTARMQKVIKTA